jgi:hypothetical protein
MASSQQRASRRCVFDRLPQSTPLMGNSTTRPEQSRFDKPFRMGGPERNRNLILAFLALFTFTVYNTLWPEFRTYEGTSSVPLRAQEILNRCHFIKAIPGPPSDFLSRQESDRFVPGTKPTLIANAKIWTGNDNGTEVILGDILLDKGIIKGVGRLGHLPVLKKEYADELDIIDADGAWVTPGIVDIHSHLGVGSSPHLNGASDTNSRKSTILPWLRSLDGLNTHDEAYRLSISGGVTTALVLPGSANAIGMSENYIICKETRFFFAGGQAFVIKLRRTAERSPISMVLEPPYQVDGSLPDPSRPPRWRHMK